jgi:hypothetical protein
MSEVEKQESQKTVVAFITGLLIGGLLVWVFSSAPADKDKTNEEKTDTDTEQVDTKDEKSDEKTDGKTDGEKETTTETTSDASKIIGKGAIAVSDQASGEVVTLGKLEFPTKIGWVVVRDLKDGKGVGVLGAALYNTEIGLIPTTVPLMRATVKDNSYQVVFFTNNGDSGFSIVDDKPLDEAVATFKAN